MPGRVSFEISLTSVLVYCNNYSYSVSVTTDFTSSLDRTLFISDFSSNFDFLIKSNNLVRLRSEIELTKKRFVFDFVR